MTTLSILSALLVHVGAGDVSVWLQEHRDQIAGAILAVGPLATGYLARRHVTPTSAPRNNAGEKLTPTHPLITLSASDHASEAFTRAAAAASRAQRENSALSDATSTLARAVYLPSVNETATAVDEALADADTVYPSEVAPEPDAPEAAA
jgi:hypothetical protein